MYVDVLGPLKVSQGVISVVPTAPKAKVLLALLAMRANQFVPVSMIVQELWPKSAPAYARTAVQTYVLDLRKRMAQAVDQSRAAVGSESRLALATESEGYVLKVTDDRVALRRFEMFTAVGYRAREQGDFQAASDAFAKALALWRGDALSDIRTGPQLQAEVEELEEAHLNLLDRRIDADLRLGRHHELLGELRGIIARHPTHEGLCAHLMLALYRAGRRSEALEVYHKVRSSLVKEFGLEPSPALRRLQRSMLVSDQGLGEVNVTWDAHEH
ncbi:hypothetical protein GCM10010381_53270 [Streptomyces xantholiticus]|nr:hypothetical protein GCM10010381_53270 [Streptomyces xantholiticus]